MKESATAALSYVRARHREIGAPEDFYETHDLHIHVPAGATPKDGPSAGVTMMVALASLFSGRPVLPRLAMTGEITVTGKVLPVGGIKEKVLAAHRAGIRTMILPTRNRKDFLEDIPKEVAEAIRFEFVDDARQVLDLAIDMPERLQPRGVRTTSLRRHGRVRKEPRVTAELQAPLPTPELESSPRQSL
jgi:ATP-dependent Lon protease